jgi:hypothetical protein
MERPTGNQALLGMVTVFRYPLYVHIAFIFVARHVDLRDVTDAVFPKLLSPSDSTPHGARHCKLK